MQSEVISILWHGYSDKVAVLYDTKGANLHFRYLSSCVEKLNVPSVFMIFLTNEDNCHS